MTDLTDEALGITRCPQCRLRDLYVLDDDAALLLCEDCGVIAV